MGRILKQVLSNRVTHQLILSIYSLIDKESPEIPDRYKKRPLIEKEEEVETEDDSDINPYEEVEI